MSDFDVSPASSSTSDSSGKPPDSNPTPTPAEPPPASKPAFTPTPPPAWNEPSSAASMVASETPSPPESPVIETSAASPEAPPAPDLTIPGATVPSEPISAFTTPEPVVETMKAAIEETTVRGEMEPAREAANDTVPAMDTPHEEVSPTEMLGNVPPVEAAAEAAEEAVGDVTPTAEAPETGTGFFAEQVTATAAPPAPLEEMSVAPPPSTEAYVAPPPPTGYDLGATPTPPPPAYTPPGVYGQPGYSQPFGYGQQFGAYTPTSDERTMAMLAHLLALFFSFLGPLIIYLAKKNESKFVAFHALQALYMQLLLMGASIVSIILIIVLIGIPMIIAVGVAGLVFCIMGAIEANKGNWHELPIVGKWAKSSVGL